MRSVALRHPAPPAVFLARARYFALALGLVQLFHLAVFTNAGLPDFAVWLVVHLVAQLALLALRLPARHCDGYFELDWKKLAAFFVLALGFKLYSRIPYLQSWVTEGLYATRMNEDLGAGGLSSIGSIFFYPLSILLAFSVMPRRVHRLLACGVVLVCVIDLVALGTRNAPMFVLVFHALAMNVRVTRKHLLSILGSAVLMVGLFGYSTANRTSESVEGDFDWLVLFEFTSSAQIVSLNKSVVEPIAKQAPEVLPAIFLTHYLAHSIGELRNLIDSSESLRFGGGYYLTYQVCAIGLCDRDEALDKLMQVTPRPGVYQTFWASTLLDFGWLGCVGIVALLLALVGTAQCLQPSSLSISTIVLTIMMCLSPIENYFYNALGLAQTLCIFVGYWLLRFDLGALARVPRKIRSDTVQ